jgi:single-stranded-DNA-specific exonuclease
MSIKKSLKKWHIIDRTQDDIVDQILVNRNISLQEKEKFIHPDYYNIYDPFLLKNMDHVVNRIIEAQKRNEKIGIFGDYDADGITSATLMSKILHSFGFKPSVYIPSREEGYGLNREGIDQFKKEGISLLIAVDMGITGKDEVEYAKKLGIDSIIIDHHLIQDEKIPSSLIINPRQKNDPYPFKELSACGLVFKLAQALSSKFDKLITPVQLKWWLDLVAVSTIADMVPLIDENRILAYFGLVVLGKTKNIGLQSLFISAALNKEEINPGTVGFKIAPRLNAPGRIKDAGGVYTLLTTNDKKEAEILMKDVEEQNQFRQSQTDRIFKEAKAIIIRDKLYLNKVILVSNKDWSPGLVGIVAGRIMEEYSRPTIILDEQENIAKGSARSIEGYHLLNAFKSADHLLNTYGGHARAGGLSMEVKNLPKFYKAILKFADACLSTDDLVTKINIDLQLQQKEVTINLARLIEKLEPYGFGNSRPIFMLRSQVVQEVRAVGKEKNHLKLNISNMSAIFFNGASNEGQPEVGQQIDIVFNLAINRFNFREKIDLNIIDWKLAD